MATSRSRRRSRSSLGTLRCQVPGSSRFEYDVVDGADDGDDGDGPAQRLGQPHPEPGRRQENDPLEEENQCDERGNPCANEPHRGSDRTPGACQREPEPRSRTTSARGNPMTSASAYGHCAWTRFSSSLMRSPRREQRRAQSILCRALRFASPRRSRRARARAHRPAASRGWMSCRQTRSLAPPSRYRPRGRR